jgi:hypothetical protein
MDDIEGMLEAERIALELELWICTPQDAALGLGGSVSLTLII